MAANLIGSYVSATRERIIKLSGMRFATNRSTVVHGSQKSTAFAVFHLFTAQRIDKNTRTRVNKFYITETVEGVENFFLQSMLAASRNLIINLATIKISFYPL